MRYLTYGQIRLWAITDRESVTVASRQLCQKLVGSLLVFFIVEQRGTGPVGLPCSRNARSRPPSLDVRSGRSISPHP